MLRLGGPISRASAYVARRASAAAAPRLASATHATPPPSIFSQNAGRGMACATGHVDAETHKKEHEVAPSPNRMTFEPIASSASL